MPFSTAPSVSIGLSAAIVGLMQERGPDTPLILVTSDPKTGLDTLPFGPFDPLAHRTFDLALRAFVETQTGLALGYAEQLYTFGDRGRHAQASDAEPHIVSVGYLALTGRQDAADPAPSEARFAPWYGYFPWEDWRTGRPDLLDTLIVPALENWISAEPGNRAQRVDLAFARAGLTWDDERVLERYEILYEAGLVAEAGQDGRAVRLCDADLAQMGCPMRFDHRRILATAISRLRAKIKYRPLVFELMADAFTLTELQKAVEALAGRHLHKQNFRRLVETNQLVEPTGATTGQTGGRPAKLYRFRPDVIVERPAAGLRV